MGAAAAAVGVVGGIAQTIIGGKQAAKAQKAIDNYQRQELTNVYEGQRISTEGAEIQKDMAAQATATSMAALKSGGTRALVGGVGTVQAQNVAAARQIGAQLDEQQVALDRLKASDEVRIQTMQERREEADLAGLGQQLASGQQTMMSGLSNVGGALGAAGRMSQMNKLAKSYGMDAVDKANQFLDFDANKFAVSEGVGVLS